MGKGVYRPEAPINQTRKDLTAQYAGKGGAYQTPGEQAASASYNAAVNPAYVAGSPTSAVRDFADQSAWDAKYGNNAGTAVDKPDLPAWTGGLSQNQAIAKALKDAENYTAGVYTGRQSTGGATPRADERTTIPTTPTTPATSPTTPTGTSTGGKTYSPDELAWMKAQYTSGKGTGNEMVGANDPGAPLSMTWSQLNDIAAQQGWGTTPPATSAATPPATAATPPATTPASGGATGGGNTQPIVPPVPGSAEWDAYLRSVNPAYVSGTPYGTAQAAAGRLALEQPVGKMPDGTPIPPRPVAFSPMTPEEQAAIAAWDAKYAKYV